MMGFGSRPLPSPDGSQLLYYEAGNYHVAQLETAAVRNITQDVPASFVNDESDVNVEKPPRSAFGWSSDNASVLLSDGWDLWRVPAAQGRAAGGLLLRQGRKVPGVPHPAGQLSAGQLLTVFLAAAMARGIGAVASS